MKIAIGCVSYLLNVEYLVFSGLGLGPRGWGDTPEGAEEVLGVGVDNTVVHYLTLPHLVPVLGRERAIDEVPVALASASGTATSPMPPMPPTTAYTHTMLGMSVSHGLCLPCAHWTECGCAGGGC